jgi:hypothetical protein
LRFDLPGVLRAQAEKASGGKIASVHRQAADRRFARNLVRDDVPMFGESAILQADDVQSVMIRYSFNPASV